MDSIKGGKLSLFAPSKINMPVSKIIPIIKPVMAADARGADLKGLYPATSTKTPIQEARNMVITTVAKKISGPGRNPANKAINSVAIPKPIYVPTIKISPWAKLKSIRTPYTIEYPMDITA